MTMAKPFIDGEFLISSQWDDWFVGIVILSCGPGSIRVIVAKHSLIPESDVSIGGSDQHYREKSGDL